MPLADLFTPEFISIIIGIISIIALLCTLFYKLGRLNTRIDTLEKNVDNLLQETRGLPSLQRDVDNLLKETRALTTRIEQHILSVEAKAQSRKMGARK